MFCSKIFSCDKGVALKQKAARGKTEEAPARAGLGAKRASVELQPAFEKEFYIALNLSSWELAATTAAERAAHMFVLKMAIQFS